MRLIALLAIASSAFFTVSAAALAAGPAALQTVAGGICPATMVWDGQHCV